MIDEIKICLNCQKPKCTNCFGNMNTNRRPFLIAQIDPDTMETVKIHRSYAEAAEAAQSSERTIRRHTGSRGSIVNGYLWRRMEVEQDDV